MCRALKATEILGIRYGCLPVRANISDPYTCAIGVNLPTRMRIVWRRAKANINRLFSNAPPDVPPDAPPETPTARGTTFGLPYDIVEMIIAHTAHDLDALKACSLTCRPWYTAAVPHLHRTLTLSTRGELKSLSELHHLGLSPIIKEIRVEQNRTWFAPQAFGPRDLGYFSAFTNVRTLRLRYLEIHCFIPGIETYFSHFSPTLQSITLFGPICTPQQLPYFLSLFSNLDNIMIWETPTRPPNTPIPDTELLPFSTPRLQGRLVLYDFNSVEICTRLIALGSGLRFCHMDLCRTGDCAPVLFEACAQTLETLRIYAADRSVGGSFSMRLSTGSS